MASEPTFMIRWRGRQSGPYEFREIEEMLDAHEIGMCHEVLWNGRWTTLEEALRARAPGRPRTGAGDPKSGRPERRESPALVAPDRQDGVGDRELESGRAEGVVARPLTYRPRRRIIYVALGLAAGFTGLHNVYGRRWLRAAAQALLSAATTLLGFGWILSWLWALGEIVVVQSDGYGMPMR